MDYARNREGWSISLLKGRFLKILHAVRMDQITALRSMQRSLAKTYGSLKVIIYVQDYLNIATSNSMRP